MKEMVEELSSLVELRKELHYLIHGEGIHKVKPPRIIEERYERMSDEWWEAVSQHGEEEAIHVVAELWGYSLFRAKQEIKKIEEGIWL